MIIIVFNHLFFFWYCSPLSQSSRLLLFLSYFWGVMKPLSSQMWNQISRTYLIFNFSELMKFFFHCVSFLSALLLVDKRHEQHHCQYGFWRWRLPIHLVIANTRYNVWVHDCCIQLPRRRAHYRSAAPCYDKIIRLSNFLYTFFFSTEPFAL